MAPGARRLSGPRSGLLPGAAIALYTALLPYVVASRWSAPGSDRPVVRALLVALGACWLTCVVQVARNVVRLRRGERPRGGGSAWLATLLVAALGVLASPHPGSLRAAAPAVAAPRPARAPAAPLGALALALAARRRAGDLRRDGAAEDEVDDAIAALRGLDDARVADLRARLRGRDGVVRVAGPAPAGPGADPVEPLVACVVEDGAEPLVAFAREGGALRVPVGWGADVVAAAVVALHDGGRVETAATEAELVRALATRSLRRTAVVFLGPRWAIDAELAACCVTVAPGAPAVAGPAPAAAAGVRVELLRAAPRVVGLVEPFAPTLRRRCLEMVAYLALHRREPVTGERLRARVLGRADADATARTLANTASAVRRSLGVDGRGPRLHPVTSSGLYETHGVDSDVERFTELVARARSLAPDDAAPVLASALGLVRGEPLASALRGFEWFLAEGHAARLARDGEWAALALARHATRGGDVESAFWALSQGRLIDPYSDELALALAAVPRLREFGGDRLGRAQHDPVGAGGAVGVGRALERLGDEVVEDLEEGPGRVDEEVLGQRPGDGVDLVDVQLVVVERGSRRARRRAAGRPRRSSRRRRADALALAGRQARRVELARRADHPLAADVLVA